MDTGVCVCGRLRRLAQAHIDIKQGKKRMHIPRLGVGRHWASVGNVSTNFYVLGWAAAVRNNT